MPPPRSHACTAHTQTHYCSFSPDLTPDSLWIPFSLISYKSNYSYLLSTKAISAFPPPVQCTKLGSVSFHIYDVFHLCRLYCRQGLGSEIGLKQNPTPPLQLIWIVLHKSSNPSFAFLLGLAYHLSNSVSVT